MPADPCPVAAQDEKGAITVHPLAGRGPTRSPWPHVGSTHDEFGQSRATVSAAPAEPDQRDVTAAGGDQGGESGVLRVAARLAPHVHPVSGAGDRAGYPQIVIRPGQLSLATGCAVSIHGSRAPPALSRERKLALLLVLARGKKRRAYCPARGG